MIFNKFIPTGTAISATYAPDMLNGIVTLEDMTEELVGDIRDEYDLPEEKGGERTERAAFVNGVATIEGGMTIEDFADAPDRKVLRGDMVMFHG